jgi:hypothetical protein
MQHERDRAGRFSYTYPSERQCLPLSRWPEPDRLALEHARGPGDAFALPGPAARWAPETYRLRIQAYGAFLAFCPGTGCCCRTKGPAAGLFPSV